MDQLRFVKECQVALWSQREDCQAALSYLMNERGLSEALLRSLEIGYCTKQQTLPVMSDGWSPRPIVDKIIVPIRAEFGELVSFAGRSPDPSIKGWWNGRFDKQNHLFLLHNARRAIRQRNKVYLLEGYMDAMTMHQEGLDNACSLMGLLLGYRRVGLLKRYCNRVCLCFDTDVNESGQKAQNRAIAELSRYKFETISKIELPLKIDPDEFVLQHGIEEYLGLEIILPPSEIKRHVRAYKESR